MSKGTKIRNVRVADEVWLPAKDRAAREGVSLTELIVERLREYGSGGTTAPECAVEEGAEHR